VVSRFEHANQLDSSQFPNDRGTGRRGCRNFAPACEFHTGLALRFLPLTKPILPPGLEEFLK